VAVSTKWAVARAMAAVGKIAWISDKSIRKDVHIGEALKASPSVSKVL